MKTSELIAAIQKRCRLEHLSLATERDYCGWARRFMAWLSRDNHAELSIEDRISGFLSEIAEQSAESTQNQALCALIYAHKSIDVEVGKLPDWTRAQRPRRLPEWCSDSEVRAVLGHLRGDAWLGCALMYGSGLRVNECARLRWRDVDVMTGITVRAGKGDKDRVTCFPSSVLAEMDAQKRRCEALWREDRERDMPGVQVPDSVGRKQPRAGETFGMFWVFPAAGLSVDPRSGVKRRHHLHADTFAKSLAVAARRANLRRRITPHALRHSFATAYLIGGGAIHELQELLGHANIATTSIYLHCLPTLGARAKSPLDQQPSNIVQIPNLVPLPKQAHG